ncbi:MAG: heparinase II/III family protein [Gemmatimonadaceae bacterium]
MSLLLDAVALDARRAIARGPLAPLAQGLRAELAPVLGDAIEIPREKALLSRTGGRCPDDGTFLRFDPLDPRHVCPTCGVEVTGELHDRFRPYWYQLWLAERVLHAAVLGVLLDDAECIDAAWRVLDGYADRYLDYRNRDNVLGPSRPFFSTYLESIWLLQLVLAVDLLESAARHWATRGARVRDRIVEPSVRLIASYDEGVSNRQVWNDAAMLAAGVLLDDARLVDRAVDGSSGLRELLSRALLADGSWYEGENYHLFAHRGLWYAVTMAERFGRPIETTLTSRFDEGFAAPFRTLLPDLTYPSRRDSQYAVSVRQPRFAESCELGLARRDDPRLVGMLARLYDSTVPAGDTGRRASTADVERNLPATGLTRADLSWRSLLFARASLPPLEPHPLESDLLPAQGFGILRRHGGHCFVGLDYGRSGGGHGHPDRLDLLLSDGDVRWFDDPGTGSYVDESLHWYRSTLAHTAPLIDGRSQPRVDGELAAFEDLGAAGWIRAQAELAPGCVVHRTVVVVDDYLVDRVEWESEDIHEIALPFHGVHVAGAEGAAIADVPASIDGADGREDGFAFLADTRRVAQVGAPVRLTSSAGNAPDARLHGWLTTSESASWWTAVAPGPPGRSPQPLVLVRSAARRGGITGVWSWRGSVRSADIDHDAVTVTLADGSVHVHRSIDDGWRIQLTSATDRTIELGRGLATSSHSAISAPPREPAEQTAHTRPPTLPFQRELGTEHYRRSEETWKEADRPTCIVSLEQQGDRLVVRVDVPRAERRFVAIDAENPFDNDPAAIHGDGVQLYVAAGAHAAGWLLVPIPDSSRVARRTADGWSDSLPLDATWQPSPDGYVLVASVTLPSDIDAIDVDVLVNESAPGHSRRRGQLVLSGALGEFVYLRADRHERDRLLHFALGDG